VASDAPAEVDVQLGGIIKALRMAKKLSQTELGLRIGVSFQQVQKYERGLNRVSASTLVLIAKALDISAAEILQTYEARAEPGRFPDLPSDPLEQELLMGFRAIASPGRRRAIAGLVAEIAKL